MHFHFSMYITSLWKSFTVIFGILSLLLPLMAIIITLLLWTRKVMRQKLKYYMMSCNVYMSKTIVINETIIEWTYWQMDCRSVRVFLTIMFMWKPSKVNQKLISCPNILGVDRKMIIYVWIKPRPLYFDGFKYQGCECMSRFKICFDWCEK